MNSQTENTPKIEMRRVTHYGKVRFGDVECEAVVLDDGTRGFVQRQLIETIGFKGNGRMPRFRRFLTETAPNALNLLDISSAPVSMHNNAKAMFVSHEIVPAICDAVVDAALDGTLHPQRRHLIAPCRKIQSALSKVGIVALIDEATGYQYVRESDALQDLFTKLIRSHVSDWERRFHPDYYKALFKLFGWEYQGHAGGCPPIIGKLTGKWVYEVVFPQEIVAEIKTRRKSERLHQWLTKEDGLPLLEKKIAAVTTLAQSAYSPQDFESRFATVFYRLGAQGGMFHQAQATQ